MSVQEERAVANSRSAKKQIRVSERKRIRNRSIRSAVRTRVTHTRRALSGMDAATLESELKTAVQALDQAAEKGVLHKNNVARRKARLMSQVHKRLLALHAEPEKTPAEITPRTTAAKAKKAPAKAKAPAKTAAKK
ncbi:MAG: 30S ribosomal protein S20 [Candidatus Dormibacteria bacterium]